MKRIFAIILIAFALLALASCATEHEHTPEKITAIPATCTTGGTVEHYHCGGCDKLFSDFSCTREVTAEELSVAPLGHEWDGACDTDCNRECGEERTAENHLDKNEDEICDICNKKVSADIPVSGGEDFLPPDEF